MLGRDVEQHAGLGITGHLPAAHAIAVGTVQWRICALGLKRGEVLGEDVFMAGVDEQVGGTSRGGRP